MDQLDKILEEIQPVAAAMSPTESTPKLRVETVAVVRVTVSQLLGLCQKYPNHPYAPILKSAIQRGSSQKLDSVRYVERIHLLAMIENKEVETVSEKQELEVGGGVHRVPVHYKRLVELGKANKPDASALISEMRSTFTEP